MKLRGGKIMWADTYIIKSKSCYYQVPNTNLINKLRFDNINKLYTIQYIIYYIPTYGYVKWVQFFFFLRII